MFRRPVVTNSCGTFHSHARLRVRRHPAFPAPSVLRGPTQDRKPRAHPAAGTRKRVTASPGMYGRSRLSIVIASPSSLRGAKATKQSILLRNEQSFCRAMDCFASLAKTTERVACFVNARSVCAAFSSSLRRAEATRQPRVRQPIAR